MRYVRTLAGAALLALALMPTGTASPMTAECEGQPLVPWANCVIGETIVFPPGIVKDLIGFAISTVNSVYNLADYQCDQAYHSLTGGTNCPGT